MRKQSKIVLTLILPILLISLISAVQVCEVYDDFSSDTLDTSKWEIRKDYEGQPFIADSGLDADLENFHTRQDSILGDHRTYLVPKYKFKAGDMLEYDINFIYAEGNSVNMFLVDNQYRFGLGGCWDGVCRPFEKYHNKIEFGEGQITFNEVTTHTINNNVEHEVYIGTVFGHNGIGHIDYDNFIICTEQEESEEPPQPNELELRVAELEQKVEELEEQNVELENRTSWLESIVDKIVTFIENLPKGLIKNWGN